MGLGIFLECDIISKSDKTLSCMFIFLFYFIFFWFWIWWIVFSILFSIMHVQKMGWDTRSVPHSEWMQSNFIIFKREREREMLQLGFLFAWEWIETSLCWFPSTHLMHIFNVLFVFLCRLCLSNICDGCMCSHGWCIIPIIFYLFVIINDKGGKKNIYLFFNTFFFYLWSY